MLTRESVKIILDDDDEPDYDAAMAMTPEEEAAEEAEFDREMATFSREYGARMARLTPLQRYRYERHEALVALLRSRSRLETFARLKAPPFIAEREAVILKKRQADLVGWRHFLRTGIMPVWEKQ